MLQDEGDSEKERERERVLVLLISWVFTLEILKIYFPFNISYTV